MLHLNQIFLSANVSPEAASNSAVGMIGSFIAAALLIVVPAVAFLIFVSQKDSITRARR